MAIPVEWSHVTLTGRYISPDGLPEVGKVEFRVYPPHRIKIASANTVVVPKTIVVDLDENGAFEIDIPSTNDPDISPHFRWHVRERFVPNRFYSYYVEIPYDANELDIADLEHDPTGAHIG